MIVYNDGRAIGRAGRRCKQVKEQKWDVPVYWKRINLRTLRIEKAVRCQARLMQFVAHLHAGCSVVLVLICWQFAVSWLECPCILVDL